jgi:hypothetical protein
MTLHFKEAGIPGDRDPATPFPALLAQELLPYLQQEVEVSPPFLPSHLLIGFAGKATWRGQFYLDTIDASSS